MSTEARATLTWAKRLLLHSRSLTPLHANNHLNLLASHLHKPLEAGLNCSNQENIAPFVLTADDLDETNTRLFVKSLSPELHDYGFLYRVFRVFGRIRMLALNTKRHNAIVEFESKVRVSSSLSLPISALSPQLLLSTSNSRHFPNISPFPPIQEAALSAKRDCRCISALSGRTYTYGMEVLLVSSLFLLI